MQRLLIMIAGLLGALGVASAAAASHSAESRNLASIAAIFLSHGPALLALGLCGGRRAFLVSGIVLALGTAVFGADLAMREWAGSGLFSGAAPIGGGMMILGWLGIAATGLVGPRKT
jgi:uncharacterized membrane protein YgdD (TMEM256/DUF423 family)